jgi:hypothetical protein
MKDVFEMYFNLMLPNKPQDFQKTSKLPAKDLLYISKCHNPHTGDKGQQATSSNYFVALRLLCQNILVGEEADFDFS